MGGRTALVLAVCCQWTAVLAADGIGPGIAFSPPPPILKLGDERDLQVELLKTRLNNIVFEWRRAAAVSPVPNPLRELSEVVERVGAYVRIWRPTQLRAPRHSLRGALNATGSAFSACLRLGRTILALLE